MTSTYDLNFSRSAVAPVISAGVMMANIIWKAKKRMGGMVRKSSPGSSFTIAPSESNFMTSAMKAKSKFPTSPPPSPKARENPTTAQMTPIRPIAKTFCINMPRTFLLRTIPP
jgi:hypothetical protein